MTTSESLIYKNTISEHIRVHTPKYLKSPKSLKITQNDQNEQNTQNTQNEQNQTFYDLLCSDFWLNHNEQRFLWFLVVSCTEYHLRSEPVRSEREWEEMSLNGISIWILDWFHSESTVNQHRIIIVYAINSETKNTGKRRDIQWVHTVQSSTPSIQAQPHRLIRLQSLSMS